jgi:hypothetical protein
LVEFSKDAKLFSAQLDPQKELAEDAKRKVRRVPRMSRAADCILTSELKAADEARSKRGKRART